MSAVIGNPTPEETNHARACLYTFRIGHLVIVTVAEPHVGGHGTPQQRERGGEKERLAGGFTNSHLQPVNIK